MTTPSRKTQIVATIGPASRDPKTIRELILSGVNICRLNLKHETPAKHGEVIERIRKVANNLDKTVRILVDIPRLDFAEALNLIEAKQPELVALSYIKRAEEIAQLKSVLAERKIETVVVAKIETPEALNDFNAILDIADTVMVARGDLGESIALEKVPFVQKEILLACQLKKTKVIVATEMLLSMVSSPQPTRAEVSDVANAVLDGAHGVMLSEETAIGMYPAETVTIMRKIILEAESWQKIGHLQIKTGKKGNFVFG